jgi:hypothetical protein
MFASHIGLIIVFGPPVLAVIVLLLVGSTVRRSTPPARPRSKALPYDLRRHTHTNAARHGFIVDPRVNRRFVKPRRGHRHQAGGSKIVDGELDTGGSLPSRSERHIGRLQACLDAFRIFNAITARFNGLGVPDEHASREEWREFGHAAISVIQELAARTTELGDQITTDSTFMVEELRSTRRQRGT